MHQESTPKLKKGMKLFAVGSKGRKFFHLDSAVVSAPIASPLPEAFKLAADMTIDSHLAAKGPHHDALLFPVLYLYRHCIELQLKQLLLLGIRMGFFAPATVEKILDEEKGIIGGHRLSPLWDKAKKLLEYHFPGEVELKFAESVINDLHQVDPDGQTLRYDRTKGRLQLRRPMYRHLRGKQKGPVYNVPDTIDIANLRHTVDALYSYLEGSYGAILDEWDAGQQAFP